ncbi:N-acetylmuramoyl-L-alanine amidase family protein [Confluentibacter flavum]|uniref:N-acetylmuramoyl-L-alanine amidase n=1 Tax=Confluentibacter flavum TaxID=1909700 RepID=A0A2N3HG91_9FLAO|nr:N-acetylmuramoyl-L-alanine amidase [Confluentibacter flavum]PKQ43999.1 N-acetylmuramoyl-L-alanine amidase [Confluentibacter flavum]
MRTKSLSILVFFIVVLTLSSFVVNDDEQNKSDKFVVVLDAGHGGKDPGNLGNGYREKDIALNVVLGIGEELEKNPDIKVVYTRKTDVFVDLFDRGKIANKANADLFVSVHCNAHKSQAYGTETFVLGIHKNQTNFDVAKKENAVIFMESNHESKYAGFDPNSPESAISIILGQEEYLDQSILLASFIQDNFTNKLKRTNRKVKQAGLIVLHQTVMPSVLVELGFLTNNAEGAYLNSKKGQNDMSSSIADAILKYKKSLDLNVEDGGLINEHLEDNETPETITTNAISSDIEFKVQISAGPKDLITKPYNFKGLEAVSKIKEDGLYKYFYGLTSDYNVIRKLEDEAKSKGYTSCFIVAFKQGKKIPLSDALKTTAN